MAPCVRAPPAETKLYGASNLPEGEKTMDENGNEVETRCVWRRVYDLSLTLFL